MILPSHLLSGPRARTGCAAALFWASAFASVRASDCNRNGIEDAVEIAAGAAADCDHNGGPDACDLKPETAFVAGPYLFSENLPWPFLTGDFDGDGWLDFVETDVDPRLDLVFHFSRGEGRFERKRIDSTLDLQMLRQGGIDGDGDVDLAGANQDPGLDAFNNVSFFFNDGAARFGAGRNLSGGVRLAALDADDFDGDGALDFAVTGATTAATVGFGDGRGGIVRVRGFDVGERLLSEIAAGDLNRDGLLDLACFDGDSVTALDNAGGRRFRAHEVLAGDVAAAADFDGDGIADLALAHAASRDLVLHSGGPGGELRPMAAIAGSLAAPVAGLEPAQLDGDGLIDLLVTYLPLPRGAAYRNSGKGSFEEIEEIALPWNAAGIAAADLDGDGDADFAAVNAFAGRLSIFLNHGDGRFTAGPEILAGLGSVGLAAIDVDLDGDLDLLSADAESATLSVLIQRGAGSFSLPVQRALALEPAAMAPRDLDGDGRIDLALADAFFPRLAVLFQRADGAFDDEVFLEPPLDDATVPVVFGAGDIDGDGLGDLVVSGRCYFRGLSGRRFERRELPAGPLRAASILLADLDGDGFDEVLEHDAFGGDFVLLRNRSASALDCDGNGRPDGCDIASGALADCDRNGIADRCEADCDGDGVADRCEIRSGAGADCDRDGVPDDCAFALGEAYDGNQNGIPDACEAGGFHRGDANEDGGADIADAVAILAHLFAGGRAFGCREAADADNDGALALTDALVLLNFLFAGGPPPAPPGPPGRPCGFDPDPRGSPGDLGCERYSPCRGG